MTRSYKLQLVQTIQQLNYKKMRVRIATWGREFALDIGPQEPVLKIKQRIERLICVPVNSQTLTVCDWELLDGLDMEDYPIVIEGTKIDLTIHKPLDSSTKIQIYLRFSSRRIPMEVDNTETVHSLKEKIYNLDGTPTKKMSLHYSGWELDDEFRNLSEYGIRECSEVIVFCKATGRKKEDIPVRQISIVIETSSSLLNAVKIPLEIKDSCSVNDLRDRLVNGRILPENDYIFIHKQRIMRENCSLRWHGVGNSESIYVFTGTVSRGN